MIMTIINTILSRWQLSFGILAVLVLSHTLAYCEGREDGREAQKSAQAAIDLKAQQKARQGDQDAAQVVEKETDDVEARNQRAKDAAADSDDPLRAFLDSLRREAGSGAAPGKSR